MDFHRKYNSKWIQTTDFLSEIHPSIKLLYFPVQQFSRTFYYFLKKNKFNHIKSSNECHMLLTQSAEKHGNGLSKNCVFTQSMPQRSMRYQESTKVCASALKAQY